MPEQTAYGSSFYDSQAPGSYRSARLYAAHLAAVYEPKSVADFGCGVGPWLKAFAEQGAERLRGYDGPWNKPEDMVHPAIEFVATDLNRAATEGLGGETFDLAMTLEVAEHLEPENSPHIVRALCAIAPVVMFGAAFLHQPGTRHINRRRHSDWANLFAERGYAAFDYFRPTFWGHPDVEYWYQQNTFLYVRRGHPVIDRLRSAGLFPAERLETFDCVHPDLLDHYAEGGIAVVAREAIKKHVPERVLRLLRR